jgi:hypothetical protein
VSNVLTLELVLQHLSVQRWPSCGSLASILGSCGNNATANRKSFGEDNAPTILQNMLAADSLGIFDAGLWFWIAIGRKLGSDYNADCRASLPANQLLEPRGNLADIG